MINFRHYDGSPASMTDAEYMLRKLLWIRHGCESPALYGDDGELQCHACRLDFLRQTAEEIEKRFEEIGMERYISEHPELVKTTTENLEKVK